MEPEQALWETGRSRQRQRKIATAVARELLGFIWATRTEWRLHREHGQAAGAMAGRSSASPKRAQSVAQPGSFALCPASVNPGESEHRTRFCSGGRAYGGFLHLSRLGAYRNWEEKHQHSCCQPQSNLSDVSGSAHQRQELRKRHSIKAI